MSPVNMILLRGSILVIHLYFFFLFLQSRLPSHELFQQIFRHVIYMSEAIVSIAILQYKQSWFYPISGLSEQTCKLGFLLLIKLCFLLFFLTVAFFTAEKKGGKRDVSNKLFQILYTRGRIACKSLNAIFDCGKST